MSELFFFFPRESEWRLEGISVMTKQIINPEHYWIVEHELMSWLGRGERLVKIVRRVIVLADENRILEIENCFDEARTNREKWPLIGDLWQECKAKNTKSNLTALLRGYNYPRLIRILDLMDSCSNNEASSVFLTLYMWGDEICELYRTKGYEEIKNTQMLMTWVYQELFKHLQTY